MRSLCLLLRTFGLARRSKSTLAHIDTFTFSFFFLKVKTPPHRLPIPDTPSSLIFNLHFLQSHVHKSGARPVKTNIKQIINHAKLLWPGSSATCFFDGLLSRQAGSCRVSSWIPTSNCHSTFLSSFLFFVQGLFAEASKAAHWIKKGALAHLQVTQQPSPSDPRAVTPLMRSFRSSA